MSDLAAILVHIKEESLAEEELSRLKSIFFVNLYVFLMLFS